MKIRYHIATISFCPNLTNPEAHAIPVGILMLAETGAHSMALLAVREAHVLQDSLPPLIRSVVEDFPAMLQAQLEEILASEGDGSIDDIMSVFEDSLRNSFFVSELMRDREIVVDPVPVSPPTEPWRSVYPEVVMTASRQMMAADVMPDELRQHFKPWIHRPHMPVSTIAR